ncbi:MAG: hypothetical protein COU25_00260 [Candidatus Levybacteria bacterium CG10_big_fil_rev_8_21_14_0_10_35_13]|nr:MAG: hypothetical protein COU25_00260 [Candidatus Levybacteria bacterium CG10_big_fil_rev_8_21_14_0_10_35_13]
MSPELGPKGRRSKGAKTYISRQKAETRRTGRRFDAPPLQAVRTPEQRTEWDEVIEPKIRDFPNYPEISPYMSAVRDFWQTRRSVAFEGKDAFEASKEFDARHPELERDHVYDLLRPAFGIIIGRFKQVTSVMGSRRK